MTATNLPEFASHLANYLRYATGDKDLFARVILESDTDNNYGTSDYIVVGICVHGIEHEMFAVEPSEVQPGWMLSLFDHRPGTRHETPYTDVRVIGDEMTATAVLGMIAEHMFRDKLASAQECLAYDLNPPDEAAP